MLAKFVPANITLLPQLLKTVGYSTHIVGKFVIFRFLFFVLIIFFFSALSLRPRLFSFGLV